jgi:hypothetical protein
MGRLPPRTSFSKSTGGSSDGLDEARWRGLYDIVVAASHGDATATRAAVRRLASQISNGPADWQAVTYLMHLLQYTVIKILGCQPEPHDLHRLADVIARRSRRSWLTT